MKKSLAILSVLILICVGMSLSSIAESEEPIEERLDRLEARVSLLESILEQYVPDINNTSEDNAIRNEVQSNSSTELEEKLYTYFEHLNGYHYDSFDNKWYCYGTFHKQYSQSCVLWALNIQGTDEGVNAINTYCWVRDQDNQNELYHIDELDILIGDNLYKCSLFDTGYESLTFFGEESHEFLEDIANAAVIDIRFIGSASSYSYDEHIEGQDLKDIQELSRIIVEQKMWRNYIGDQSDYETCKQNYPIVKTIKEDIEGTSGWASVIGP